MVIYRLKLEDQSGAVIATREFEVCEDHAASQEAAARPANELALEAVHDAAIKGLIPRKSVSAEVMGVSSVSAAAKI